MNYKKNGKFALALRIKNKGQGATVQPISASGLKDACSLLYQSWSDAQLCQCLWKFFDACVEKTIIQSSFFHKIFVGCLHGFSWIAGYTSQSIGQKCFLMSWLPFDIQAFKKVFDTFVRQHFGIKISTAVSTLPIFFVVNCLTIVWRQSWIVSFMKMRSIHSQKRVNKCLAVCWLPCLVSCHIHSWETLFGCWRFFV